MKSNNSMSKGQSKGSQRLIRERKPQHHKINSEPALMTSPDDFPVHKVRIHPREDRKVDLYPLVVKNKRLRNMKDLYEKLRCSNQYIVYSQKEAQHKNSLQKEKSKNFKLITESTRLFRLPPIQPRYPLAKPKAIQFNQHSKRGLKASEELNKKLFDSGRQDHNQMVDVLLANTSRPAYNYLFPTEYERIHINDKIKLYKNNLTVPAQANELNEGVRREESGVNIKLQFNRYKDSNVKPRKLKNIFTWKKMREKKAGIEEEKLLREINESFLLKYQNETKETIKDEINLAIYTKEVLSTGVDLILQKDSEEFNKMQFDSSNDY